MFTLIWVSLIFSAHEQAEVDYMIGFNSFEGDIALSFYLPQYGMPNTSSPVPDSVFSEYNTIVDSITKEYLGTESNDILEVWQSAMKAYFILISFTFKLESKKCC